MKCKIGSHTHDYMVYDGDIEKAVEWTKQHSEEGAKQDIDMLKMCLERTKKGKYLIMLENWVMFQDEDYFNKNCEVIEDDDEITQQKPR